MFYRFGSYELDTERCTLRCGGQDVTLEPKVYDVLVYLVQHHGRLVRKDELLEHCWPDTFVGEAALARCMAKVRRALQPEAADMPAIKTVYGRGYCFALPVTVLPQAPTLPHSPVFCEAPVRDRSRILIVDDEPLNVDYLEQMLEELGYETCSAFNGQEALEKVVEDAPDLILLDVMMPCIDGFTVCRLLKEHEETQLIPIIMMTALDATTDRIQGIKAGADDFLTKPVNEEELLARIATALKRKHTVDRTVGELRTLKAHIAQFIHQVTAAAPPLA